MQRIVMALFALCTTVGGVHAQNHPYGKGSVELSIGSSIKGSFGQYGGIIAGLLPHYLGEPQITMKELRGASGIPAALRSVALDAQATQKGDRWLFTPPGAYMQSVLQPQDAKLDAFKELVPIGIASQQRRVCWGVPLKDGKPPLASAKETEYILGTLGRQQAAYVYPVLYQRAGYRFKIVAGYKTRGEVMLAIERGEVHGMCGVDIASVLKQYPNAGPSLNKGKPGIFLLEGTAAFPEVKDVPRAVDIMPKNVADAIRASANLLDIGRLFVVPRTTPPEKVQALRTAFDAMIASTEFKAAIARRKLDDSALTSAETRDKIAELEGMSAEHRRDLRKIMFE